MKEKRCYNSGPISGLTYLTALHNFESGDKLISGQLKMKPVNPMEITWGLKPDSPWLAHMIKDVCLLVTCSAVYFQNGWIRSRGARLEYQVAKWLGKEMYFEARERFDNASKQMVV